MGIWTEEEVEAARSVVEALEKKFYQRATK